MNRRRFPTVLSLPVILSLGDALAGPLRGQALFQLCSTEVRPDQSGERARVLLTVAKQKLKKLEEKRPRVIEAFLTANGPAEFQQELDKLVPEDEKWYWGIRHFGLPVWFEKAEEGSLHEFRAAYGERCFPIYLMLKDNQTFTLFPFEAVRLNSKDFEFLQDKVRAGKDHDFFSQFSSNSDAFRWLVFWREFRALHLMKEKSMSSTRAYFAAEEDLRYLQLHPSTIQSEIALSRLRGEQIDDFWNCVEVEAEDPRVHAELLRELRALQEAIPTTSKNPSWWDWPKKEIATLSTLWTALAASQSKADFQSRLLQALGANQAEAELAKSVPKPPFGMMEFSSWQAIPDALFPSFRKGALVCESPSYKKKFGESAAWFYSLREYIGRHRRFEGLEPASK